MKSISSFLIPAAASAALTLAWVQAADGAPQMAVNDAGLGASISYEVGAGVTRFTAVMPEGWSFQVQVDGDRDGKWGTAAYTGPDQVLPRVTGDFAYGVDTGFYLCSQYILGWSSDDPGTVQVSTDCDGRPSKAYLQASAADAKKHIMTTYVIPNTELFGARQDAAIVFQIWDKKAAHLYFSLSAPLLVHR